MRPGGQRVRQSVERSMQEKRVCALHMVLAMWKVHTCVCVCVCVVVSTEVKLLAKQNGKSTVLPFITAVNADTNCQSCFDSFERNTEVALEHSCKGYIDTTKAACGKHVHLLISHSKIVQVQAMCY